MNTSAISQDEAAAIRKSDLARLLRQASFLREQGNPDRAAELEANEIAGAVRAIRLAGGPEALPEGELQAMVAAEQRRVVDAVILAKLLITELVGDVPANSEPDRNRPVRSAPAPVVHPPMAGPPAISDMLDAMLAAERTGRRPAPAIHRES